MKRVLLGLVVATLALSAPSALAGGYGNGHGHGHHPRGWNGGGHYANYRPRGGPYGPGCYPPPRVHYRGVPVPVAPVYPAYPVYPPPARQGFSYFSPGFSLSISR
jgi:hypothetical protein